MVEIKKSEFAKSFTKQIKGLWIDPKVFTFNFNCKCNGECCNYGVFTDLKEHDFILSIKDKIIPLMDETQSTDVSKWFEPPEEDEEFESGIAVGTEIINGKCTFLDKEGLCVLQKLAIIEGEHEWNYKPAYCILFPLTVYEGSLTIDDDHINRLSFCNKQNGVQLSIFEACRAELEHFFGSDDFQELENYKVEYLSQIESGVEDNGNK